MLCSQSYNDSSTTPNFDVMMLMKVVDTYGIVDLCSSIGKSTRLKGSRTRVPLPVKEPTTSEKGGEHPPKRG